MPSFTMQMTPELQKAADRVRAKLGVRSVADAIRQLIEDSDGDRSEAPAPEREPAKAKTSPRPSGPPIGYRLDKTAIGKRYDK